MEEELYDEEYADEQSEEQAPRGRADHLKPYQFQPGVSGNPGGRPPGSKSLKQFAKEYLESLPDEEKIDFMRGMDKRDVWQMAEGKPDTKVEGDFKVNAASVIFGDDEEETEDNQG